MKREALKHHYYANGGPHTDEDCGTDVQPHKFGGKVLDTMHGLNWYDFHARQQDAATGMFTSMDPLCEKYYHISPYVYCAGNPVNRIDPHISILHLAILKIVA